MASKTAKTQAKTEEIVEDKIAIKEEKIAVPSFKYKKAEERNKRTYAKRNLIIPERPGGIVRIYLEKDGSITTEDGPDHELILGEFELPHDEYETIEKKVKGKTVEERIKKAINFSKINVTNFEIPDRS